MDNKENVVYILRATNDDAVVIKLLSEVLDKALNYVIAVDRLEYYLLLKGDDKDEVQRLDQRRALAHNALIDSVIICERYLREAFGNVIKPAGGIYTGNPHDLISPVNRRAIGDWAGRVVFDIFRARR